MEKMKNYKHIIGPLELIFLNQIGFNNSTFKLTKIIKLEFLPTWHENSIHISLFLDDAGLLYTEMSYTSLDYEPTYEVITTLYNELTALLTKHYLWLDLNQNEMAKVLYLPGYGNA